MNNQTGEVRKFTDEQAAQLSPREWTLFAIGEEIDVKGIVFLVKEVSHQRLVLKFKNPQRP